MAVTNDTSRMAGRMLRYLQTWHADDGGIHSVHTHPVWHIHPGLLEDHYTGYSAWGAPYLLGLADAVAKTGNEDVWILSERLVDYLVTTQMENERWDNAGAEFGRCFNASPIDNMFQNLSLAYFAGKMRDRIGEEKFSEVGARVRRNLDSYIKSGEEVRESACLVAKTVNQDCAGLWACFEWMNAFGEDPDLARLVRLTLDAHLERHAVNGIPDADCAGMSRHAVNSETEYIEPAEYYGVIIPAYVWGAKMFEDQRYLDAAWRMARHVIRNTWMDHNGCRRLHRSTDFVKGEWRSSHEPMLISGGGLVYRILAQMNADTPDAEVEKFLADMIQTLTCYQNEYGMITQASGWHDEFDVICGTVWQCHDFAFLAPWMQDTDAFNREYASSAPDLTVVLGWNDTWLENGTQWAIRRPKTFGFGYVGEKTAEYGYPAPPHFINTKYPVTQFEPDVEVRKIDDKFILRAPEYERIAVTSIYGNPWEREA